MRQSKSCPDTQSLAALVDGRVSEAERRRLLAHIDSCEECFTVFTETARFLDETSEGKVVKGRFGGKKLYWGMAAAAALLLAIFQIPTLSLWLPWASPQLPNSAELLAPLLSEAPAASLAEQIKAEARLGFAPNLSEEALAFRTGVLLVDLHVAAQADEALLVDRLAADAAQLSQGQRQDLAARCDKLRERLQDGVPAASLGAEILALESAGERSFNSFYHRLGRWAETGRLIAAGGEADLLTEPPMNGFLDSAIDRIEAESTAHRLLLRIRLLIEGDVSPADRQDLVRAFSELIELF